jgi:acyl carrier protein
MPQAQLQQAFIDSLGLEPDTDVPALEYGQHPNWDSVGHMALVAELEDRYGIMLETDDVVGMSSYPIAVETLRRYGASV